MKAETLKSKMSRCRALIDRTPFGCEFTAADLAEFNELTGVDATAARHMPNPTYPSDPRYVQVRGPDGWDGISWTNRIRSPNPKTELHKTLRVEIDPIIAEVKAALNVRVCPNPTGNAKCNGPNNLQVDHVGLPFDEIASMFIAMSGPIDIEKGPPGGVDTIRDRDLAAHWIEFHASHATYQILCRSCNASKGKR